MTPLAQRRETDLNWTAFQYVAGGLDEAERRAFEQRLDEDQLAREAVAAAVEIVGAVRLVAPEPTPVFRLPAQPWLWGVGTAVAAGLLVWLLPAWLLVHQGRSGGELALAWSDMRGDIETGEPADEDLAAEEGDDLETVVPNWMLDVLTEPSGEVDTQQGG